MYFWHKTHDLRNTHYSKLAVSVFHSHINMLVDGKTEHWRNGKATGLQGRANMCLLLWDYILFLRALIFFQEPLLKISVGSFRPCLLQKHYRGFLQQSCRIKSSGAIVEAYSDEGGAILKNIHPRHIMLSLRKLLSLQPENRLFALSLTS